MRARTPRKFDWNLRSCGRHGHVTYAPDEPELRARLHTETASGEAWKCLRCETFVVGPPLGSGPAEDAPLVLRGPALKDAFILRALALERLVRAVLLTALAYGIHRFDNARDAVSKTFQTYLPLLKPLADRLHIDLQDAGPVRLAEKALAQPHSTLELVVLGVAAYAALQYAEGIGLWLLKRWGEYVAVVGTSAFVPLEVYELVDKMTWFKLILLIVNVAAVVYLVWSKHLFGVRGGYAAFEAERHSASVIEIEVAAAGGR
ncbi:MAG: DUF2127 domain-containing protein [Marmoricola sp.]